MRDHRQLPLRTPPRIGSQLPGWSIRLATAAVGAGLAFSTLSGFWFWSSLALLAVGILAPRIPAVWGAIIVLAGSTVWHAPSVTDARIYALIAGCHLLHLLASYALVVPVRSRIAVAAFAAAGRRFLIIQLGSQAAAVLTLVAFASPWAGAGARKPVFDVLAILAAVALIGLLLALLLPLPSAARSRR